MTVYLEVGQKRIFACAADWPGLSRAGKDESAAVEALLASSARYAKAIESTGLDFPREAERAVMIAERLPGGSATDFGAPMAVPSVDRLPSDEADVARLLALLDAAWNAFENAEAGAAGVALRKGPRGGGRDTNQIAGHALDAHAAYLKALGGNPPAGTGDSIQARRTLREATTTAVIARARGELPEQGPRGGERWSARVFTRRAVWHLLDHAWEIEDRTIRQTTDN